MAEIIYAGPKYLLTSEELMDPEVGAVEIGKLEKGKFIETQKQLKEEARKRGITNPRMLADLVVKEEMEPQFGSKGKPYPIVEEYWEDFASEVPHYCGDKIPKVYMVDGNKYTGKI